MAHFTNDYLMELAKKLTVSAQVYSNTLSKLAIPTPNIKALSQTMKNQIDAERKLFDSASSVLKATNRMATSPIAQSLAATNSTLTEMAKKLAIPNTALTKIYENQRQLQDKIKQLSTGNNLANAYARIDTSRILAAALVTQAKLANIDKLHLGKLIGINSALSKRLSLNLSNLTSSYQTLIDFSTTHSSVNKYLPLITTYAPVDYYREINVLENITTEQDLEDTLDPQIDKQIGDSLPKIDDLLNDLNPRLLPLLEGARKAADGDNPDRARHITTSLRELFTQVAHKLAPDQEIRNWTTNSEHYYNNRPTRRARLLFICRNINLDPLTTYLEHDVTAALSFVDSLNSGTHTITSKLTQTQLSLMVVRMESLLLFLLRIPIFD